MAKYKMYWRRCYFGRNIDAQKFHKITIQKRLAYIIKYDIIIKEVEKIIYYRKIPKISTKNTKKSLDFMKTICYY